MFHARLGPHEFNLNPNHRIRIISIKFGVYDSGRTCDLRFDTYNLIKFQIE